MVDEPFIGSKEDDFGCTSPIHSLPFRAAEVPVAPQLIETSPVKWVGLLTLTLSVMMKQKNSKAFGNGYRFIMVFRFQLWNGWEFERVVTFDSLRWLDCREIYKNKNRMKTLMSLTKSCMAGQWILTFSVASVQQKHSSIDFLSSFCQVSNEAFFMFVFPFR